LGVPAQIFVNYVRKLMEREAQTNGVDLGLQQSTGEDILLSNQQITGSLIDREDLENLEHLVSGEGKLKRIIRFVSGVLPSETQLKSIYTLQRGDQASAQKAMNDALEDIPTKFQFNKLLRKLKTAKSVNDAVAVKSIIRQFEELLDLDEADQLQAEAVNSFIKEGERPAVISLEPEEDEAKFYTPQKSTPKKSNVSPTQQGHIDVRNELIDRMMKSNMTSYKGVPLARIRLTNSRGENKGKYVSAEDTRKLLRQLREEQGEGSKMSGMGLTKKRVVPKVDVKGGLERTENYVPFGRYIIQRHRLSDNILMMRHKRGGAIVTFPTHKISTVLSKIFRKLIQREMPSYEEVGNLTKDEQSFLHKVIKHAQLEDQMKVPCPTKSEEEQENDRFEILKGEISAGNDNSELVKEFKQLLFKFIQEGKIPRRQGHEILMDLTSLGY